MYQFDKKSIYIYLIALFNNIRNLKKVIERNKIGEDE